MLSGAALIAMTAIAAIAITRAAATPIRRPATIEAQDLLQRAPSPRPSLEDVAR
jgi:hypothetical protein